MALLSVTWVNAKKLFLLSGPGTVTMCSKAGADTDEQTRGTIVAALRQRSPFDKLQEDQLVVLSRVAQRLWPSEERRLCGPWPSQNFVLGRGAWTWRSICLLFSLRVSIGEKGTRTAHYGNST